MVEQYPDTITVSVKAEPTQNETTGNFTAGTEASYTFKCRAEVNGSNRKIVGADGVSIDYSFLVYMPKTTTVIPVNSEYSLITGNATFTGKIKAQGNGQLNSRLWL